MESCFARERRVARDWEHIEPRRAEEEMNAEHSIDMVGERAARNMLIQPFSSAPSAVHGY